MADARRAPATDPVKATVAAPSDAQTSGSVEANAQPAQSVGHPEVRAGEVSPAMRKPQRPRSRATKQVLERAIQWSPKPRRTSPAKGRVGAGRRVKVVKEAA